MAAVMVYSEKTRLVQELFTAASEIGCGATCALALNRQQAEELAEKGIKSYYVKDLELPIADTASMALILQQAADRMGADLVLLSSNRRGKELAGRLAQARGAGCLTDVKGFDFTGDNAAYIRNTLGGATVATQLITSPRKVIAVTPRAFSLFEGGATASVEEIEIEIPVPSVKVLQTRSKSGDAVDIQAAERLVIVGQGLQDQGQMELIEKIAGLLGAEIACSKPVASDRKWLPEERVVGLSGKICKPALALILGVSGQVQFTVGVREAQVIISINNDENAFMNKISDYYLEADLQAVLPELVKALEKN